MKPIRSAFDQLRFCPDSERIMVNKVFHPVDKCGDAVIETAVFEEVLTFF